MFVVAEAATTPTAAAAAAELTSHGAHPDGKDSLKGQGDGEQTFHGKSSVSHPISVVVAEVAVAVAVCVQRVIGVMFSRHTGHNERSYGHYPGKN